ncbi:hypothetical protein BX611_1141 [Lutibacter oceani]|uniref:Uncharacterized protein n=1 Tax=Lutibacter oceani TaxID=1853311 RepID=A0A3D9RWZ7_9FLAO|nr:hypothetical protein [Lutibacter oceani]REE81606.1 hypothetical protein BX611_1141 [Lutibacter oceani]
MKTKIKKDWRGRVKSIEELHNDSKIWLSEIDFINFEIRFLEHLLSSKYIDYLDAGLYDRIEEFTKQLFSKKADGIELKEVILEHEKILSDLIDQNCVTSNKNYLATHNNLALEINTFISKYKYLKMQIFEVVEKVMKKKEQKKLK